MKKLFARPKARPFIQGEVKFIQKALSIPLHLLLPVLIISLIGIAMMYSAGGGSLHPWASKQLAHLFLAIAIAIVVSSIDVKFYYNISYILYFISLGLLIAVELFGYTSMGAKRWLNILFFRIQPSDFMKLAIILVLARYYHDLSHEKVKKVKYIIFPLILVILPIGLIAKQPDLGTAILLLLLSASILFVSGVRMWKFTVTFITVLASIPLIWHHLHTYQKNRILIFLNPESDPLGAGYNIMQSKIAIGSAGALGKGFLKGTQSQLSFLPERHTDFIFTMFAEEWGFIGCITLILLYCYIAYCSTKIAVNCKNHFGRILAIGSIMLIFIHVVVNIAMVMGLLPVVGVPLPLMSYGGTIMITIYIAIGFIANSYIHKKIYINNAIKTLF